MTKTPISQKLQFIVLYGIFLIRGIELTEAIPNDTHKPILTVVFTDITGEGMEINVCRGVETRWSYKMGGVNVTSRVEYMAGVRGTVKNALVGNRCLYLRSSSKLMTLFNDSVIGKVMMHLLLDFLMNRGVEHVSDTV